jgi:2-keto-4-pentenoate hydratase
MRTISLFIVALLLIGSATVSIASEQTARQLAQSYLNRTAAHTPSPPLSADSARTIQASFIQLLQPTLGPEVGYKAALTSRPAQEKFGVHQPVMGVLLEKMLLHNGSRITTTSGIRLMAEADLLVRVKSTAINSAGTQQEFLAALSEVIPFIEIPDLVYKAGEKLSGPALVAINAGARYGVMGSPIPITATPEWEQRLQNFQVTLHDAKGNILAEGKGSNLMGHPLAVVRWLRDNLKKQGLELKPGDLISLGSLTRLIPAEPEMELQANYSGLNPDNPQTVEVSFNK